MLCKGANAEPSDDQRAFVQFVARVFTFRRDPSVFESSHMPSAFIWMGLYDADGTPPYRPLCPLTSLGMDNAISAWSTSVLQTMVMDPPLVGRALTLLVQRALSSTCYGSLCYHLGTTDLHGDNKEVIQLVVHDVHQLDHRDMAAAP